jgi:hypothetical protein
LPEIIGYVGAALIVSAGLNLISQTWDSWPEAAQLAVLALGVLALYSASAIITVTGGGFAQTRAHVVRRRLIGVMLALAAPLLAASFAVALDWAGISLDGEGNYWAVAMITVALCGAGIAAWWAPGVVPTLAVAFASFLWLQIVIGTVLEPLDQPVLIAVISAALTLAWLAIAPRLLPPRVLTEALGVAAFILFQLAYAFMAFDFPPLLADVAEQQLTLAMWFSRVALLVFAAVALVLFARGGSWVWAVGGVVAAGTGALSIAGQTFGLIAGLFVAGIILLAASGVLLVARGRREKTGTTSAPAR